MRRLPLFLLAGTLLLAACGGDDAAGSDGGGNASAAPATSAPAPEGIDGVVAYDITPFPGNGHTEGPVHYDQDPPVAGNHNPVWANCKFYDEEIPSENAVHSLEHGAVWITYTPDADEATLDAIRAIVDADETAHTLASEYPDQDSPIVLTAWNRQLTLDSIDDPRVPEFIDAYRFIETGPEPGATCSGGAG